ncbi:MAG: flagellar basal body-associated FliL family protein [Jatrophihabitantaceae bacterium]
MTATTSRESRFVSSGDAKSGGKPGTGSKAGEGDAAAPKKSLFKSKKFLIIVIAVLALGGGGYMFLKPSKTPPPTGGDVVAMDPTTLNLAGGHYLKIAVAVELVKGAASTTDFASSHAAELVIDEFSNRTVDSLSSNTARKKLTAQLLAAIQKAYPGKVFDIFLTQFVTQ